MTMVDTNNYCNILQDTICEQILRYGLSAILFLIFGSVFCYKFFKIKKKMKVADKKQLVYLEYRKKKAGEAIGLSIVGVAAVILVTIPFIFNAKNDLQNQQFVVIQTEYCRSLSTSRGNFVTNGHAVLEIDGKNKSFDLPSGWTSKEFPEGEYNVIACYAKDTEILIAVEIID